MNPEEEPLRIIGNESNQIFEISPGSSTPAPQETTPPAEEKSSGQSPWSNQPAAAPQPSNDLATNDGSVIQTLDKAFHNDAGVEESTNPSGSNRADFYETRANGQSDAEEEVKPA